MMYDDRLVGDIHVLTPRKNLVGGQETRALTDLVTSIAAGTAAPRIVLDLERINWVSSLGIEALRRIHRTCAAEDGWMRVVCVGSRIRSVLLAMRLHWVFETYDTVDEALVAPDVAPVHLH